MVSNGDGTDPNVLNTPLSLVKGAYHEAMWIHKSRQNVIQLDAYDTCDEKLHCKAFQLKKFFTAWGVYGTQLNKPKMDSFQCGKCFIDYTLRLSDFIPLEKINREWRFALNHSPCIAEESGLNECPKYLESQIHFPVLPQLFIFS